MLEGSNTAAMRRTIAALMLALVAVLAASCGGGGTAAAGGSNGILKVGTTNSIDSLNPFVAINPQAVNAFNMEYPQLVQYSRSLKLEGDWAKSWSHSADGLTWTFHLLPGTTWSDGRPMTSADVVWSDETVMKYAAGATAIRAGALEGVKSFAAPNPTTVVITYKQPVGNALSQLQQFLIYPKHVWASQTGNDGKDLKRLPAAGPPADRRRWPLRGHEVRPKGTTVFKPNPRFYGPDPTPRRWRCRGTPTRPRWWRTWTLATSTSSTRCRSGRRHLKGQTGRCGAAGRKRRGTPASASTPTRRSPRTASC